MHARHLVPWLAAVVCGFAVPISAQAPNKRALTHDDYDHWRSLRGTALSPDGKWLATQIEPQWGDGQIEVRQIDGDVVHRYALGSGPRFSADSRYVAFSIGKSKVEERKKRIEELAKKGKVEERREEAGEGGGETLEPGAEPRAPGGGARGGRGGAATPGAGGAGGRGDLGILDLATGKVEVIARTKGFRLLEEAPVLVYHLDKPEEKKPEEKKDGAAAETPTGETKPEAKPEAKPETAAAAPTPERRPEGATGRGEGRRGRGRGAGAAMAGGPGARGAATPNAEEEDPEKRRKEGTPLVVRNLANGQETRYESVAAYGTTRKDKWLWLHVSAKQDDPKLKFGLFAVPPTGGDTRTVLEGIADFSAVTSTEDGATVAFASNKADWKSKKPQSDLYVWDGGANPAQRVAWRGAPGLPSGKLVSAAGASFSKDGRVLGFAVQDPPEGDAPPMLPEEKVSLDIWHWQDGQLQTQQAKQVGAARNPAWSCVYHRDSNRIVVLGDDAMPRARMFTPDGSRALVTDDTPYQKLVTWDGRYSDVYLVNTFDGSRTKILTKQRENATGSPHGKWLLWFGSDYHWHALDVQTRETRNLTQNLGVPFQRTDDDHPHPDPAHGVAGWTKDDAEVVLYDEFDLWKISPKTGQAVCITDGFGRANKLRLRYQAIADGREDREWLPPTLWLSAVDTESMSEGFYTDSLSELGSPRKLFAMDKNIDGLQKAKAADRLIFTVQTFAEFPDVWTAASDFSGMKKLTDANPQQRSIAWGNAEMVRWTDADGRTLKGVLVKPEGFDPARKYPMMVHFYERHSQSLHSYVAPAPGTSPNAAYYVSNGYLWFMPDVHYEEGYPGESCVKCVVSGVQSLIAKGFVDEKGIGASGHSWGGYQTAFLVTRTNIFAAVESGAPVSNMISAYGGIRYSSGMSRQFQYEQTQSRIGGTPWQYPLRFWENSPIFFADKVKTPVLVLHNDQDGAVPWTQGIEYLTALRRLGKPAYLFNYTGEDHGLRKRPNMKDWSRRMAEYFDHHLKGKPMPKWMKDGVPFLERDKEKLPFTPSFLEANAVREKAKAVEAAAPATVPASTESSGQK